jgi:hypothetical protein
MTTYVIHDSQGQAVSVGTVVANPLPEGLTAVALSTEDAENLRIGWRWNPATLSVDIAPEEPEPDPTEEALAVLAEVVGNYGADALRQVVALALTVTSNVEALEQAVIDEDPLAGVVVVKDAAVAANEIAASLGQEETPE